MGHLVEYRLHPLRVVLRQHQVVRERDLPHRARGSALPSPERAVAETPPHPSAQPEGNVRREDSAEALLVQPGEERTQVFALSVACHAGAAPSGAATTPLVTHPRLPQAVDEVGPISDPGAGVRPLVKPSVRRDAGDHRIQQRGRRLAEGGVEVEPEPPAVLPDGEDAPPVVPEADLLEPLQPPPLQLGADGLLVVAVRGQSSVA